MSEIRHIVMPDRTIVFARDSSGDKYSTDQITRFALNDVPDDEPAEMGPDFECRVVWTKAIRRDKFTVSCRTEDGSHSEYGEPRLCDDWQFDSFEEAVAYLKDGKLPHERGN